MKAIEVLDSRANRINVMIQMTKLAQEKAEYAKKRIKLMHGGYKGSKSEYEETVLSYWKRFGKKPERYWYTMYCNGKDRYDPRYIPDTIYYQNILPYFNEIIMRRSYTDKCMYDRLLEGVRFPETVVKNIHGYFFSGKDNSGITREEAVKLCLSEDHLIIKPSLNSGRGKAITFYDRGTNDAGDLEKTFDKMANNFVVQRLVKQHAALARINPDSLNTIRVVSFRFKGEVHILSTILRMGGIGSRIDNISAGGISCVIKPNGWLADKAVTRKSEWTDHHASGIKFKDIQVPNFEGVIDAAKRLHTQLPYFNIIGWDFAVGEDNTPIMIEFNVMPEPNQISCGPTFGDLTDEVLDEVFLKKTLKR